MTLHQSGVTLDTGMIFLQVIDLGSYLLEDVCNRLGSITPFTMHEGVTRFNIELEGSHACTILTAIVLLFHEEVELVEAPHDGPILLLIIRERLS